MKKTFYITSLITIITIAIAWTIEAKQNNIGNPASINCAKKGGELKMEETPRGTIGVCYFQDNRQCEEWALFRNECPKEGVKVTGYCTKAARYCRIIGGEYETKTVWIANTESDYSKEPGTYKLPNGKICDAWKLWTGDCPSY